VNNIYLSDYQLYRLGHDKFDQMSQSRTCGIKTLGVEGQEIEKAKDRPSGNADKTNKSTSAKTRQMGQRRLTNPKGSSSWMLRWPIS